MKNNSITTNKVSGIYFAGSIAAENALPEASRKLITDRDALERRLKQEDPANWYRHPELHAAGAAIAADPLAKAAMEIRKLGNLAFLEELKAAQTPAAA
jgi:hypothetical protein